MFLHFKRRKKPHNYYFYLIFTAYNPYRLALGQRHEDDELVLHILIHAAARLHILQQNIQ